MWCSTNKPMPDSHTVESISASKENPTCEDDGLMLQIIENWRDTSNFLSATLCLPCIYALDINFWQKESIPTIYLMFDTKSGPWPPKVRKWVPAYYARYSSAVWCNVLHTLLDAVDNHQIVKNIVFPKVRYHDAEEHANPGSWQSGLRSDRSGRKTWCQSVQNHDGHCYQVIVRWDLKKPRSANPKFSDVLLIERPSISASQSAQDAIWNMRIGS